MVKKRHVEKNQLPLNNEMNPILIIMIVLRLMSVLVIAVKDLEQLFPSSQNLSLPK